MITLRNDQLSFSFPEIGAQLQKLVRNHVETVLPRVLAEDRQETLKALRTYWAFRNASPERRRQAEQSVLNVTAERIAEAFRKKAWAQAGLDEPDETANVRITFQRTLRIPDDGKIYPLPAGLGPFPLRHVDDYAETVPEQWVKRGGVLMPMYQSEALWIHFYSNYPFAVKVGAGKINAVTGAAWEQGLNATPQNYVVLPEQPWLDGFAVKKGIIRQFVAMPLGEGYSVEEQLTRKAEAGGIQLQVYPLKAESYFESHLRALLPTSLKDVLMELVGDWLEEDVMLGSFCPAAPSDQYVAESCMGLGAGGTMRQEIYEDPHAFEDWDCSLTSRCFVHLCNSLVWRQITGSNPPHPPLTSKEYAKAGVPWFDYYRDDLTALPGSKVLDSVKSVAAMGKEKGTKPLPENASLEPELIIQYGNTRRPDEVREWVEP